MADKNSIPQDDGAIVDPDASRMSRRDFLIKGGALAGVTIAAWSMPGLTKVGVAHAWNQATPAPHVRTSDTTNDGKTTTTGGTSTKSATTGDGTSTTATADETGGVTSSSGKSSVTTGDGTSTSSAFDTTSTNNPHDDAS